MSVLVCPVSIPALDFFPELEFAPEIELGEDGFPRQELDLTPSQKDFWKQAHQIYAACGSPLWAFRLGASPLEYSEHVARIAQCGDAILRTHLFQLARRDWANFYAGQGRGDPNYMPIDLLRYLEVRRAGKMWYTRKVYYSQEVVQHNTPAKIKPYARTLEAGGWHVRWYGKYWLRAWPDGKPTPVRDAEQVRRARAALENGRLYVPKSYQVPRSQIDLAFDL